MSLRTEFRCHYALPTTPPRSPLWRQLIAEWVQMHAVPSTAHTLHRWSVHHPVLARFSDPGALVDHVGATTDDDRDQLLCALVVLAQAGQAMAGRILLQVFLPKLDSLAWTTSHLDDGLTGTRDKITHNTIEDQRHVVTATFWQVVMEFPIQRRTSKLISNISLDTLNRVTMPRRPRGLVTPTDDLGNHVDQIRVDPAAQVTESIITADADLDTVLAWAVGREVLTADEARLLRARYDDQPGFPKTKEVAAHLNCTPATLRQRSRRATTKLVNAIRQELATHDPACKIALAETSCLGYRRVARASG